MGDLIERKGIASGRVMKEDDTIVNIAELVEALKTATQAVQTKLNAGITTTLYGSTVELAGAITPDDAVTLANTTIALYVGVDGDVKVDLVGGSVGVIFKGLIAGVFYPIKATKLYLTGTTATDIVGVY